MKTGIIVVLWRNGEEEVTSLLVLINIIYEHLADSDKFCCHVLIFLVKLELMKIFINLLSFVIKMFPFCCSYCSYCQHKRNLWKQVIDLCGFERCSHCIGFAFWGTGSFDVFSLSDDRKKRCIENFIYEPLANSDKFCCYILILLVKLELIKIFIKVMHKDCRGFLVLKNKFSRIN